MKTFLILVSLAMVTFGIGCAAMSHYVTPAEIDSRAVEYAVEGGAADVNDFAGFGNLVKAEKLSKAVEYAHSNVQLTLAQQIQKDDLAYAQHKNATASNLTIAQTREEMLFGTEGLLSLGLTAAGFGTFTGILGLMRKRPGDVTPEELKQTVAEALGSTETELTEQEKQIAQLVKGVQRFLETFDPKTNNGTTYTADEVVSKLKSIMSATQDTSTEKKVAQVKVELT